MSPTRQDLGQPAAIGRWLLAVVLSLHSASEGMAATVPVTTTADESDGSCLDGDCSLRDAIATAAAGDNVVLPAGTYTLTFGSQLLVDKNLTISGAGAESTI